MTPYELKILLDVYSGMPIRANPAAPIFDETIQAFLDEGWVGHGAEDMPQYVAMPKLQVFIVHILALPAPVHTWSMP